MIPEPARYREFLPAPALAASLRCGWTFHQGGIDPAPTLVIPDGCTDLLWDGHRLTVAGPDRVAAWASLKPGTAIAALRFAPGVAAGFLGLPLDEVAEQRVPLQAMWGRRAQAVESKLSGAPPMQALGILQAWFAQADALPDPAMAWLFDRLARIDAPRPAALARHLGISERSLHRRCRHAFGYGPKTLACVLRLAIRGYVDDYNHQRLHSARG